MRFFVMFVTAVCVLFLMKVTLLLKMFFLCRCFEASGYPQILQQNKGKSYATLWIYTFSIMTGFSLTGASHFPPPPPPSYICDAICVDIFKYQ